MEQDNKKKFRQDLADIFVRSLNEKQLDWKKGWNTAKTGMPVNATSGRRYTGINAMYLYLCALESCNWNVENADNRWATYIQIQKKGWSLKESAKGNGRKVECWQPYDFNEKRNITWDEYKERQNEKGIKLLCKHYTVFNGRDIIGIPELEKVRTSEGRIVDDPLINKIASGMEVPITNDGMDSAYYKPSDDTIHLPKREYFKDSYEYNATALHELSHASGASHRLNRLPDNHSMESRAYEELVAEISACFMAEHLEIPQTEKHIENHKAYVQSWINGIKKQPEILEKAIRDAENAANYLELHAGILSKEEYLSRNAKQAQVEKKPVEPQDTKTKKEEVAPTAEASKKINDEWSNYLSEIAQETEQDLQKSKPRPLLSFFDTTKGVKLQYAITLANGDVIHIDKEQNGLDVEKMFDAYEEKLQERYLIINETEYDIAVSKDIFDNRCTIHFKDYSFYDDPEKGRVKQYSQDYDTGKEMIELHGGRFDTHFPSLEEAEVKRIVSGYLKERGMLRTAEIGDWVEFQVPVYVKDGNGFKLISGIKKVEGELQGRSKNVYSVLTADGTQNVRANQIYDEYQVKVMKKALSAHMTNEQLDLIGDSRMSAAQMDQVMQGLQEGLHVLQVAWYARPDCELWKMELFRYGMENGIPPCNNGIGDGIRSMDKIIEYVSNENNCAGQHMEEAGRRMTDNLIKRQRNMIIKDLKESNLLPEKHLVRDIERLIGITGRPQTVQSIVGQSNYSGDPEIRDLRKGICKQISHQRKQMQSVNFQRAGQVMIR